MAISIRKDLLLLGQDVELNDNITILNPSVGDILTFGEDRYFHIISMLNATSYQIMLFLHKNGIDYEDVSDYDVFLLMSQSITSEDTKLIFNKELNLSSLILQYDPETNDKFLTDDKHNIIIDKAIYHKIIAYIRAINKVERDYKVGGNKHTKNILLREAKRQEIVRERLGKQSFESILSPLVSSLCNHPSFKYKHSELNEVSIYSFWDSIKRIQAFENYQALMSGIYSGGIDPNKIKKKDLDWTREL